MVVTLSCLADIDPLLKVIFSVASAAAAKRCQIPIC